MARVGIVDLRDLQARYAWDELHIQRLLRATGLSPEGPACPRFTPPEVVLAVVPDWREELVEYSRAWLSDARAVVLLRCDHESPPSDPELAEFVEAEWQALAQRFPIPVELMDWKNDVDVQRAVDRARDIAQRLSPSPSVAPSTAPEPCELPPGPAFELEAPPRDDLENLLACALRLTAEGAVLECADISIRLATPPTVVQIPSSELGAVLPDGRRLERLVRNQWRVAGQTFSASGFWALGFDPYHPVGWTGYRMFAFWLYVGENGIGFLSASDHDFPCGPSKKLYGYADNDPRRVELADDLSAVAYHFERDVLLTSAIPLAWCGAGEVDVAAFPRDPRRAAFFVHDSTSPYTDDLLAEDARDRAPVLVLGPSVQARYALDLSEPTYRILGTTPNEGEVALVGEPAPGFAVFDAAHCLVRRCSGRLLGGAGGHALVVDDGVHYREDLATGRRRELQPASGEPVCAVPVPGTINVLLVSRLGDGRQFAQLL